jgi:hypothetical protein
MALKVDYYTALSRAVAGLDRDSYAARGVVYDREHRAMMRRLLSTNPPCTAAEIEREQRAFRAAVRTIEFGDEETDIPIVPRRDTPEEQALSAAELRTSDPADLQPGPAAARRETRPPAFAPKAEQGQGGRWPVRAADGGPQMVQETPFASEDATDVSADVLPLNPAAVPLDTMGAAAVTLLQRKPIAGRVLRRALLGVVLLGLGAWAYDVLTGEIGLPFVSALADRPAADTQPAAPPSTPALPAATAGTQQVILFDGNRPDPNASHFAGTASWRLRLQNEPSPVVTLDLAVPGRKIALTMTMRREPPGSAMTHLFEFRFLRDDKEPDPDIVNIAAPFTTTAEMERPNILVGQVVNVTPGVFLFGLSGEATARERNLRNLQDLPWIGIPIGYRNGVAGLLVVEKGADGQRAISEALRQSGP